MATTVSKYVEKCMVIYNAKPEYELGCSGLKKCDCIGMDKYSFRENGVKFSTTGTNYTMRHQVENVRILADPKQLQVGDVVFKAKNPGQVGYALPAKYKEGGSEYNGDLRDYYHIGTVKSVNPLQIIHMTSPTAKMDTTLAGKNWGYAATWKKEYVSDEPEPVQPTPLPVTEIATVVAKNGKSVKMREKPNRKCNLYWDIPVGAIVTVKEKDVPSDGTTWAKIVYSGLTGYMMQEFLLIEGEPVKTLWTVHIPHLDEKQAQALLAQYSGAYMTNE